MKLAEALQLRADHMKLYSSLLSRISDNATYQEGEESSENPAELFAQARALLNEVEQLIRNINRTNSATVVDGRTMTDMLAERDVLRLRHKLATQTADAGSVGGGHNRYGFRRIGRSELKELSNLDVPALRREGETLAQRLRELDSEIQQTNWATDLIEW